jgi:hypothetical protein
MPQEEKDDAYYLLNTINEVNPNSQTEHNSN